MFRSTIMFRFGALILLSVLLTMPACQSSSTTDEEDRAALPPNIILILADDLEYTGLSSYGAEPAQTPNLDSLSERAVFWRAGNQKAVRKGDWKYVQLGPDQMFPFNLATDMAEEENVIDQYPEEAAVLHQLLAEWEAEVGNLNYSLTNL